MKHPASRDLFAHWNERRGIRLAPERADIEPAAIRQALGDAFVLAGDSGASSHPFRLAGTRLCALFGRELKGESFVKLWHRAGQAAVRELIAVVIEEKIGVVASISTATKGQTFAPLGLELLLLPLAYRSRDDARLLGAMAPMSAPYWLGIRPIGPLTLGMFRHVRSADETAPLQRLSVPVGRFKHGLTVYDGGRAD